tara:strand:+ start:294 stop:455 length:162 start_codon:yes stop_codon:yes gene_type:complete
MCVSDLKICAFSFGTLAISMTSIEVWLKIILLCVTIGYTVSKWINVKNKKDDK